MPNPEREDAVEREWVLRIDSSPWGESATVVVPPLTEQVKGQPLVTVVPKSALLAAEQRAEEARMNLRHEREQHEQTESELGEAEAERDAWILNSEAGKDGPSVLEIVAERDDYKARVENAMEERNRWIRAFNRLEKAVCRHEDATVEFRTENDEALHAAHRSVMSALSNPHMNEEKP